METFELYVGAEGQSVSQQVKKDSRPLDITGSTVRFNLRYEQTDDLLVDDEAATIDDAERGLVSYNWDSGDLDVPGEYMGWWVIVQPDTSEIHTDEFLVIVNEHAPGIRTRTGGIYRQLRSIMPVTISNLEQSEDFGDSLVQDAIEENKIEVFGVAVPVANEITYDIRVQKYIARVTALDLIPGAIDYWMNQRQAFSTTGTSENATYPNRIEALKQLAADLTARVAKDKPIIEDILDIPNVRPSSSVPLYSDGSEDFKTPLGTKHFRDYAFPDTTCGPW